MTRARLHWFWRALIAMVVAYGAGIVINVIVFTLVSPRAYASPAVQVTVQVVGLTFPVAVYGLLTRWYGPGVSLERETRCRMCGYILRGITEPRCSECGERI